MRRTLTRFWFLVLILISLIILTGASKEKPGEKQALLNSPVFGDFHKAKKIKEPGRESLEVWKAYREAANKFYGVDELRSRSRDSLEVKFDEVWVSEQVDYLKLGKKKGSRNVPDLVKLYWRDGKVQALTVERSFKLDPITWQIFPKPEYKLVAIFPRDYLLQELAKQAAKDRDFNSLLPFLHLDKAKQTLAEGNPDHEDLKQRTYGRLDEARKHLEAVPKKAESYQEAQELLQEVVRRERDLKKFNEVMQKAAAELAVKGREELAAYLDRDFLSKGFDVKMELSGPEKSALKMDCVLFNRPLVFLFLDKSDLLKKLKTAGVRQVTFANRSIKYAWEIDLDSF